ncbi:MAG: flagellar protein FliS [Alphaproteobacteria bacterium]|nr:flagellar protein FliS [Alphaproteobacteria bacterium]MBV9551561.1 flagellar protein FliS [Alphaproteobacteria bacterium]
MRTSSDDAAGAYRAVEGTGATPEGFMKMALDATRNLLLRAEMAIEAGDRAAKAQALGSAGKVVEFMLGLSGAAPGDLSECLASVYQYVLAAILKGNAGDDKEAVGAARVALDELAATWRKIFPDVLASDDSEPELSSGRRDHA